MKKVVWLIACPECEYKLRVPDKTFFGRRAKCPKCGNKFVLEEPKPTAKDDSAEQVRAGQMESSELPDEISRSSARGSQIERAIAGEPPEELSPPETDASPMQTKVWSADNPPIAVDAQPQTAPVAGAVGQQSTAGQAGSGTPGSKTQKSAGPHRLLASPHAQRLRAGAAAFEPRWVVLDPLSFRAVAASALGAAVGAGASMLFYDREPGMMLYVFSIVGGLLAAVSLIRRTRL